MLLRAKQHKFYVSQTLWNRLYFLRIFSETFYFFGDNNHEEWQDLLEQYKQPPYRLPLHLPALSFGLAGKFYEMNNEQSSALASQIHCYKCRCFPIS